LDNAARISLTGCSLITGHNTLNWHLYNIGITDSPMCMEVEETTKQIVLDCKQAEVYRKKHLGSPDTLRDAVKNTKALTNFLDELGWLEYRYPTISRKIGTLDVDLKEPSITNCSFIICILLPYNLF
jgi:hypothetical protein